METGSWNGLAESGEIKEDEFRFSVIGLEGYVRLKENGFFQAGVKEFPYFVLSYTPEGAKNKLETSLIGGDDGAAAAIAASENNGPLLEYRGKWVWLNFLLGINKSERTRLYLLRQQQSDDSRVHRRNLCSIPAVSVNREGNSFIINDRIAALDREEAELKQKIGALEKSVKENKRGLA